MVAVALVGMLLAAFMAVRIGRSGVFQLDQFQKAMAGHSGDQLTGSAGMEWRRQFRCANIGIGHGSLVGVALNPGKRSSPSWLGLHPRHLWIVLLLAMCQNPLALAGNEVP